MFQPILTKKWPSCQKGQKTKILYPKSTLIQDWVFRLGSEDATYRPKYLSFVSLKLLLHTREKNLSQHKNKYCLGKLQNNSKIYSFFFIKVHSKFARKCDGQTRPLPGGSKHHLKLMFSKKATKIEEILTVYLTLNSKCQIKGEDFVNFCGYLRKHHLRCPQPRIFSEGFF